MVYREVRQESLQTVTFTDDTVICTESWETWRYALQRRGMKVVEFKYLESTILSDRKHMGQVKK